MKIKNKFVGSLVKRRKSDDGVSMCSMQDSMDVASENSNSIPRKKLTLRTQLAHQILHSSNKTLRKPILRPFPLREKGLILTTSTVFIEEKVNKVQVPPSTQDS